LFDHADRKLGMLGRHGKAGGDGPAQFICNPICFFRQIFSFVVV
jgi:hypothetical protein